MIIRKLPIAANATEPTLIHSKSVLDAQKVNNSKNVFLMDFQIPILKTQHNSGSMDHTGPLYSPQEQLSSRKHRGTHLRSPPDAPSLPDRRDPPGCHFQLTNLILQLNSSYSGQYTSTKESKELIGATLTPINRSGDARMTSGVPEPGYLCKVLERENRMSQNSDLSSILQYILYSGRLYRSIMLSEGILSRQKHRTAVWSLCPRQEACVEYWGRL